MTRGKHIQQKHDFYFQTLNPQKCSWQIQRANYTAPVWLRLHGETSSQLPDQGTVSRTGVGHRVECEERGGETEAPGETVESAFRDEVNSVEQGHSKRPGWLTSGSQAEHLGLAAVVPCRLAASVCVPPDGRRGDPQGPQGRAVELWLLLSVLPPLNNPGLAS